jgi:PAS domain S-box-containing protein
MSEGAGRQQFFERCPAPALVIGFDGHVEDANSAWQALAGWSRDEVAGRPFVGLLHPDDVAPSLAEPVLVRRGGLAGTWDARLLRRDGSAAWLNWDIAASHERERYFCVARQLSAEEARRQERFKTDFINMAAHELNTPLTPIQLALDTLAMRIDPALGRDTLQSVEIVRRNFLRFKDLVTELLDAARIHAGRLPLELGEVDLSGLAQQAAEDARGDAAEAGVAVRARIEPGLRAVADPARLRQVLDTYLECGIACAPAGSEVEVEVKRSGGEAVVAVSCDGAGITAGQREQLFLPFPPHDDPAPQPRVGTGLGLYMARGIIELHGGRVAAPGTGAGLTLSFALPLEGPPAPLDRAAQAVAQPAR